MRLEDEVWRLREVFAPPLPVWFEVPAMVKWLLRREDEERPCLTVGVRGGLSIS